MSSMKDIFLKREPQSLHCGKWEHYFAIYERFFAPWRGRDPRILEIGVQNGGSIDLYRRYFGSCKYVGIDIDPRCKSRECRDQNVEIRIGDSGSARFLSSVAEEFGEFDIIIDDGSHDPEHQVLAFKCLYSALRDPGVYCCEDLHSNFFSTFAASGRHNPRSFLSFAKQLSDGLAEYVLDIPYYAPRIKSSTQKALDNHPRFLRFLRNLGFLRGEEKCELKKYPNLASVCFFPFLVAIEKQSGMRLEEICSGTTCLLTVESDSAGDDL